MYGCCVEVCCCKKLCVGTLDPESESELETELKSYVDESPTTSQGFVQKACSGKWSHDHMFVLHVSSVDALLDMNCCMDHPMERRTHSF